MEITNLSMIIGRVHERLPEGDNVMMVGNTKVGSDDTLLEQTQS